MSKLYVYYQKVGGDEEWHLTQAENDLSSIKPTFVTVLKLDTIRNKDTPKETLEKTKYLGPMYFDLDDKDDVEASIEDAQKLVRALQAKGLTADDMEIYLSGKKGLHILIPPEVFMVKPAPVPQLPIIYKEIAFQFAVDTLDFKVYSAKRGRMLRTCYNQRDNGLYKVPVTLEELQELTAESYRTLCSAPRSVTFGTPTYKADMALIFDAAKQKIPARRPRSRPIDPRTLKQHLPTIEQLMQGKDVVEGAGFNKIALQLVLFAREAGLTEQELIAKCQGLIENHSSDGYRYNTPEKRERELLRMFDYIEDNYSYSYDIAGIRSLLKRKTFTAEGMPEEMTEELNATGIFLGDNCYMASRGESGDMILSNFIFTNAKRLIHPVGGHIVSLTAVLQGSATVESGREISLLTQNFSGSASLHNAVALYGGVFYGSDTHARGLFEIMLRTVSATEYAVDSEGLNLLSLPHHPNPELRKPFLAWADSSGVRIPAHVQEADVTFKFQGYPEPSGLFQTDLAKAPALGTWLAEGDNKALLKEVLLSWFRCQQPSSIGLMTGWAVACFYRQIFHAAYQKFPLMHVYGPAGTGKSEMTQVLLNLFYYNTPPVSTTPNSTTYAILNFIASSASIPLMVDEYKETGQNSREHMERLRAIFRDSYNMKESSRGGGSRTKDSYNALNRIQLTAPIVFLAEAIESETALVERYVLVTLRRHPSSTVNQNLKRFKFVQANKHVFGILGHALAAGVAANASIETTRAKFETLLAWAEEHHSLSPEHIDQFTNGQMTLAEYTRRAAGRPRVIHNHTVAAFGLQVLRGVLTKIYKEEFAETFEELFNEMSISLYSNMDSIAINATPEYIKVLQHMSEMSRFPDNSAYRLVEGQIFQRTSYRGREAVAILPGVAYGLYRAYMRYTGQTALFSSESAFAQALKDCPQYLGMAQGLPKIRSDKVLVLDEQELQRAAVATFDGQPRTVVPN